MRGPHLGSHHAVRGVSQFVDIGRFNGLGETRPPASRFKLVGRSEQRLARHNVDVDARFMVTQILTGSRRFSPALLRYAVLLRRQLSDRLIAFRELLHFLSSYGVTK